MRELLERKAKEKNLLRCAELARLHKMDRLKLYLMFGLPGETDDDIDECVRFTTELSKSVPIALGTGPSARSGTRRWTARASRGSASSRSASSPSSAGCGRADVLVVAVTDAPRGGATRRVIADPG
jgi:hypothetical protein